MKNLSVIAFFVVALAHLSSNMMPDRELSMLSKPLLMPLLAIWLATETRHVEGNVFLRRAIFAALIFSTLGDVFLMFPGGMFFLLGLGSFLIAHICYIAAFRSLARFDNGYLRQNPWWALPFLAFACLLLWGLWEGIPVEMKIPVATYAGIISIMALSVVNLKGKEEPAIFWLLYSGAVLFLISDSSLAVEKFGQGFYGSRLLVMLTYLGAQFLLVKGAIGLLRQTN